MYITTDTSKRYAVTATAFGADVRYTLADAPPELGATVKLYADDGLLLREDTVAEYQYPRISGSTVILSDTPEPEPAPEPEPEPTVEDKLAQLQSENSMLQAQVSAQSDQMDFYEDCIAELAEIVYA